MEGIFSKHLGALQDVMREWDQTQSPRPTYR